MQTITASTGVPHVTSAQMRDVYAGILGEKDMVLKVGNQFAFEKRTENLIRISDGVASLSGCIAMIEAGQYEDVEIASGTIGKVRTDLICIRYSCDANTGINEHCELVVLTGDEFDDDEGTIVLLPEVPYTGTIRDGALSYYYPLYAINIKGVAIERIDTMYNLASLTVDTDWKPLTLTENFQNYFANENLSYKISGKQVNIRGIVATVGKINFSNYDEKYVIATLPEEIIPKYQVQEVCHGSTSTFWLCIIQNNEIIMTRHTKGENLVETLEKEFMPINICYLLD